MIFITNEEEYIKTGKNTAIEKKDFEKMFGNSYEYNVLKRNENVSKRWLSIFKYWKEEGFIE